MSSLTDVESGVVVSHSSLEGGFMKNKFETINKDGIENPVAQNIEAYKFHKEEFYDLMGRDVVSMKSRNLASDTDTQEASVGVIENDYQTRAKIAFNKLNKLNWGKVQIELKTFDEKDEEDVDTEANNPDKEGADDTDGMSDVVLRGND